MAVRLNAGLLAALALTVLAWLLLVLAAHAL